MVHIKRIELSNFKSFGGTTAIPLLPEFTVVSGPNGSGKSNILDALLFCLGLASSKGMRAERLPDLVNHNQTHRGTVETSVTVTFDLGEESLLVKGEDSQPSLETEKEDSPQLSLEKGEEEKKKDRDWSVTRRLRVNQQGSYTSNYYINGETCTLTELHEQLAELRVYPEGYNVVLQGDVTSIISMNSRERREIIDEMAGVAAFDRKIVQAKQTLESVREKEDTCRIVETELIVQRDRLSQDRIKAEKYQKLRAELQEKQQWEAILNYRHLQQQEWQLREKIEAGDRQATQSLSQLNALNTEIEQVTAQLEQLNHRVKALGEEELLSLQSTLANQEAEQRALDRILRELETTKQETERRLQQTQQEIQQYQQTLQRLAQESQQLATQLGNLETLRNQSQSELYHRRDEANAIADASDIWVQQQAALSRQIETILHTLEPQRTEQAQLKERERQFQKQIEEQNELLQTIIPEITTKTEQSAQLSTQLTQSTAQVQSLAQSLTLTEQNLQIQQDTQTRLLREQRDIQRQLDKVEATAQAEQEAQGTYATKIILQAGLPGICGLVAQLGTVEPRYQLALETAAGARLGNLVVEDDSVAAAAIELLKQKRAGRATFLPLNKIQPPRFTPTVALSYANGFIDYAVNLIDCDRSYKNIFAYIFSSTVVFDSLHTARPYLGKHRIVTLEGEILEVSGAMTGGSSNQRSALHFGTSDATESAELTALRRRLQDIEQVLERSEVVILERTATIKQLTQELTEGRAKRRETELQVEQLQKEIRTLTAQQDQVRSLLLKNTEELGIATTRLQQLNTELPTQESQLQQHRQSLSELEQSQTNSEWQQIQILIKSSEQHLQDREKSLRIAEQQLKNLETQQQLTQEKLTVANKQVEDYQTQLSGIVETFQATSQQKLADLEQITQTQASLVRIEETLGDAKQDRDRSEQSLRERHLSQQQQSWELQKLQETQQTRREELLTLQNQLTAQQSELPDPMPEIPDTIDIKELGALQGQIRAIAKRLQAMEPVNMLALQEYDRTQERLQTLTEKLTILEQERTEILLRIENFTTLRFRAFKEAFDAVNENFITIFAELSDGDGYLQLEDPEDPFAGGLNLVAHPKGKPVQRLASMSGGEKSLTALSFIFALQRYRPSPFYAFDEVDMFLDGANVERLARMIKQQAQQAQFLVVSLRRPMIESSERTIGVTQARGAYTQVLGIKLQQPKSPSR